MLQSSVLRVGVKTSRNIRYDVTSQHAPRTATLTATRMFLSPEGFHKTFPVSTLQTISSRTNYRMLFPTTKMETAHFELS